MPVKAANAVEDRAPRFEQRQQAYLDGNRPGRTEPLGDLFA